MAERVPTVNDLRVKLCYICREEEKWDSPEDPPRAWTHPCQCTLVAHESCLLQWIQTSQANASRAANALKCPQCGSIYELESDNPVVLRLLDAGNKTLSLVGRVVTVTSLSALVATFGTGIYIISTAYGAYALQQFIGKEMYDLLLTEDPSNWPWHAFVNLPLIPLSLILSRTPLASNIVPIVPILLAWPTSTPVVSRDRILIDHWGRTAGALDLSIKAPSLTAWPPAPSLFGLFVFPIARTLYRRFFSQFSHWVLNTKPAPRVPARRFVWALNEGGPFRIRIGANVEPEGPQPPADGQQQQQQQQAAAENAGPVEPQDAAVVAEHTIRVSGSSLGRLIGGALILPEVSNFMGSMLFRLSKHSLLLRRILAIKPPLKGIPSPLGPYSLDRDWNGMSFIRKVGLMFRLVLGAVWGGTRTWMESDPVWWRNSIGLGLFVMAKDCIELLHLWLAKRELETRRVKNRSFAGVDIRELDLIPRFAAL